jgi:glutaredoxin
MIRQAKTEEPAHVMVYGAAWCEDSKRVCRLLDQWGVNFHYIDIDRNTYALHKVARWSFGDPVIPAVSCGPLENPRLIAPTDRQLHAMLYSECSPPRVGPLLL